MKLCKTVYISGSSSRFCNGRGVLRYGERSVRGSKSTGDYTKDHGIDYTRTGSRIAPKVFNPRPHTYRRINTEPQTYTDPYNE